MVALSAERALDAGSAQLDAVVDAKIEECRAKELPTPELRAECVADVAKKAEAADLGMQAAVAALRAYWAAVAAGDASKMAQALAAFRAAAETLPPEYFAGVVAAARGAR